MRLQDTFFVPPLQAKASYLLIPMLVCISMDATLPILPSAGVETICRSAPTRPKRLETDPITETNMSVNNNIMYLAAEPCLRILSFYQAIGVYREWPRGFMPSTVDRPSKCLHTNTSIRSDSKLIQDKRSRMASLRILSKTSP